jgi:hypothetical protein
VSILALLRVPQLKLSQSSTLTSRTENINFSELQFLITFKMERVTIPFGDNASIVGKRINPFVNSFTGIPFALPPVGDFRWKKPRKLPPDFLHKLDKPYDATQFKDLCLQMPSLFPHYLGQHASVTIPIGLIR